MTETAHNRLAGQSLGSFAHLRVGTRRVSPPADAHAKRIEARHVGRSSGKSSELNKRLRRDELGETGNKREKCLRKASFLIRRGLGLDRA